jgi:hypothetical protein
MRVLFRIGKIVMVDVFAFKVLVLQKLGKRAEGR